MNTNFFESKLTELERQVAAASVRDKKLVTLRLHRMIAGFEPRRAPRVPVLDEDDLLFDNVPI